MSLAAKHEFSGLFEQSECVDQSSTRAAALQAGLWLQVPAGPLGPCRHRPATAGLGDRCPRGANPASSTVCLPHLLLVRHPANLRSHPLSRRRAPVTAPHGCVFPPACPTNLSGTATPLPFAAHVPLSQRPDPRCRPPRPTLSCLLSLPEPEGRPDRARTPEAF